jgi:Zn-dependent protease with chaperone function
LAAPADRRSEQARRYHRPRYVALAADLALGLGVLAVLSFTRAGDSLEPLVEWLPEVAAAFALGALAVGVSALVREPLTLWVGWSHERRFGFSRQTLGAFLGDQAKALAVTALLSGAATAGVVAAARAFPSAWPLVAAPAAALLVLVLGFVAPLVLEPIFNRFEPLADAGLRAQVLGLSERAEVPVREVLVADASRRTTKVNAYVSGLGRTRRVVLFDTLLAKARPAEVLTVVAHELGHRRFRHVAQGTALGMAGAAASVVLLWALLSSERLIAAIGATAPGDARMAPFVLLALSVLGLLAAPLQAALSRRWEYACDRFAVRLTGDLGAFESAFGRLAEANLPDPAPPRLVYLWLFTHPTVPERIAAARRAAEGGSGSETQSRRTAWFVRPKGSLCSRNTSGRRRLR